MTYLHTALIIMGALFVHGFGMGITHRLWQWGYEFPPDRVPRTIVLLFLWPLVLSIIAGTTLANRVIDRVTRSGPALPPARANKKLPR